VTTKPTEANSNLGALPLNFNGDIGGINCLSTPSPTLFTLGATLGSNRMNAAGATFFVAAGLWQSFSSMTMAGGGSFGRSSSSLRCDIEGLRLGKPTHGRNSGESTGVLQKGVVAMPMGESHGLCGESGVGLGLKFGVPVADCVSSPRCLSVGLSAHAGPLWRQRKLQNAASLRIYTGSSSEMHLRQCPQMNNLGSEAIFIGKSANGLTRSVGVEKPTWPEKHLPWARSASIGDDAGNSTSRMGAIAPELGLRLSRAESETFTSAAR